MQHDNIEISNLNFFASTFHASNCNNLNINNCNFKYPNCYAHSLYQINKGELTDFKSDSIYLSQCYLNNCNYSTIENCVFIYSDGSVLEFKGDYNILNNNYFSYIDKTVCNLSSVMTSIRMDGNFNTVKYNTIQKTGASSTINPGNDSIVEYNNLSRTGYLQSDGAMIHLMVNQQNNCKIRFNWVHDSIKYGIRFDGNGDGYGGYIHHNIGWNCNGGIMVKGGMLDNSNNSVGGHYVYNNTIFNSDNKNDIIVLNNQT